MNIAVRRRRRPQEMVCCCPHSCLTLTSRTKARRGVFWLHFWTAVAIVQTGTSRPDPSSSTVGNHQKNPLQTWIDARCGPNGHAVWAYSGSLFDPLNGKKIANVEGLELVRKLAETDDDVEHKRRYHQRCGDLKMAQAILQESCSLDYAGTILSRKIFCYKPVDDPKSILSSVRLRPQGPEKAIPTDQAATVFDTAITVIQKGPSWFVHGELPNGNVVWNQAEVKLASGESSRTHFDYTIYSRPRHSKRQQTPDLTSQAVQETVSSESNSISPARSSLISFGPSKAESLGKFGARETYQYTTEETGAGGHLLDSLWGRMQFAVSSVFQRDKKANALIVPTRCSVRYTRYGEGPVWYGPNRLCTLELQGHRLENLSQAPQLAATIAATCVPGFLSTHSAVAQDDTGARRAVAWFRGENSVQLQITHDYNNADSIERSHSSGVRGLYAKGAAVIERLHAATTTSTGGSLSIYEEDSSYFKTEK
jgi:hypothetical protein